MTAPAAARVMSFAAALLVGAAAGYWGAPSRVAPAEAEVEGQTRTLFLEHADQIWTTQRPSRAVPALAGTSAAAATVAAGLGIGAAASGRDSRPGLTAGAVKG